MYGWFFVDRRQHILRNTVSRIDPAISLAMGMAFWAIPINVWENMNMRVNQHSFPAQFMLPFTP